MPQPLPLVFILPSFAGGGAERVMLTLAGGLHRRGHRIGLLVLDGSGPLRDLVPPGLPLHDLREPRLRRALPDVIGFLRRLGPARVVSSFGYVNLGLALAKPLLHQGTLLYFREANLPSLSLPAQKWPGLMRLGYRWLYPLAHRVIATSDRMAEEFQHGFRLPAHKLLVIGNPVDTAGLRAAAPRRLPGPGLRAVAVGRLVPQKGFDRLLPLFAGLPADARLILLGDGPEADRLQAQADSLKLGEGVQFAGFRADAADWIAGADCLLLPSRWEGLPNVALEALALGIPVCATPEAGGIAEIAAAAPAGAVTVAPMEQGFAAALAQFAPRPDAAAPALRPSLLPPAYELAPVLDAWAGALQDQRA